MYNISDYGDMIASGVRMNAYSDALRQAVKPGVVVLEVGTGTGFFAALACQLGARRVFALEPDDVIEVALETAVANGYADRIEFIQDLSTRVTLPERADVMISDIRGRLPLFQKHIPTIADARRRLLTPGAVLIPQSDTIWAAVVEASEQYSRLVAPWHTARMDLHTTRHHHAWPQRPRGAGDDPLPGLRGRRLRLSRTHAGQRRQGDGGRYGGDDDAALQRL